MASEVSFDIRDYKNKMRIKYKSLRKNMPENIKDEKDNEIFNRIISSSVYNSCDLLLTYVSTYIEVDTIKLINYSLSIGKKVAVPKCIDGTRNMVFYYINSMNDLEKSTFSVLEPIITICVPVTEFENALCIVPGLVFDVSGYRLGYGKGYYDRFLTSNPEIIKAGICYCSCTVNELYRGRFDVPVNLLVTEKYLKNVRR
jgi:5-formyltetrahydrofolate cyclo-ligase